MEARFSEDRLILEFSWISEKKGTFNTKIYGDNFAIEQGEWPDIEDLEILVDGELSTEFGEAWPGYTLDSYDALMKAISVYVNEETEMQFIYVCDEIKAFKEEFMKDNMSLGLAAGTERKIYLYILNSNLDKLECDACYSYDGCEFAAYVGSNEIVAIVDTRTGELITNYEDKYIIHITDAVEEPTYKLEFASENFGEVLKDYDVDINEVFKKCAK